VRQGYRHRLVHAVGGQPERARVVPEGAPVVDLAVAGEGGAVRVAGTDLDNLSVELNLAWKRCYDF
jgi:hypothetical protein